MNKNVLSRKSSIKIKKTYTGKMANLGMRKMDGYIMPLEEKLQRMRQSGLDVQQTSSGIIVKPKDE